MSAVTDATPPPLETPEEYHRRRNKILLYVMAGVVLLSLVRVLSGAQELTSSGTVTVQSRQAAKISAARSTGHSSAPASSASTG